MSESGRASDSDWLAERVEVELSAAADDFVALEELLGAFNIPGIDLRESDPTSPFLRSDVWQTLLVSISSAAGLKVIRDVLISQIAGKRAKVSITRTATSTTVTFEGNIHSQHEVEKLVHEITAEKPSE